MNPYKFDNDMILQDSVTPEAPLSIQQIPTITKIVEPPTIKVTYKARFMDKAFERNFNSLQKAIDFIEAKARRPEVYNHFQLEIL